MKSGGKASHTPDRPLDHARISEKLHACDPREVRRIIVGNYELRYEIADATLGSVRNPDTRVE